MADRSNLAAWIHYSLPILGGFIGVVYVNMNRMEFINPFFAIAGGAVAGWAVARVILRLMNRRR